MTSHFGSLLRIQVEADRIRFHETSMPREVNDSANRPRNSGRSTKLPVFFDAKDDMDAYLQIFVRYAENEGWDADCYGAYLGSLLSGKALEVYSRITAFEARDYYKLKEALLIQYQLTQEDYRKRFQSGTQTSTETTSQYLTRLEHFFDKWIRLSNIEESFEGLRELILIEKFLHSCPRELALFIRDVLRATWDIYWNWRRYSLVQEQLLEEVLSHTSLTAEPILGRIVNPNRIGRILDQTVIKIREDDCASCAGNLAIVRPLVQLGGQEDMMIECDIRFKDIRRF